MGPHPVPLLHLPVQGPFTPLTASPQCHSPASVIHSPFPHFQNIFQQHVNMWHCKASQPANTLYSSWPVLSAHTRVMQPLPGVCVLQPSTEELQGSPGISLALRSLVELWGPVLGKAVCPTPVSFTGALGTAEAPALAEYNIEVGESTGVRQFGILFCLQYFQCLEF